jgi:chaperonin GroEL (HSP60 family)
LQPKNLSALIQVIAAGANPVQITRGIEKTAKALVEELKKMSKEVRSDHYFIMLSKYL